MYVHAQVVKNPKSAEQLTNYNVMNGAKAIASSFCCLDPRSTVNF